MPNSPICVDASVVIRLVADPSDETVRALWEQWDAEGRELVAPTLLLYEVCNVLFQYQKTGLMSASAVDAALEAALSLPVELHGGSDLHRSAVDLARRFSLPAAYDAHYLALAESLQAEFWTKDGRLARAVEQELGWVHLVDSQ
ncbi:MAG: PIN domain-containing protein [Anaerolineales bacterium]|nr:MAG: PIN domain-containing protein [Anaerolineales bacterium]